MGTKRTNTFMTILLILLFFCQTQFLFSDSIPSRPAGYITDLSNTLNSDSLGNLSKNAKQLEEKHGHAVYALIAKSLEGKVLEDETIRIAEQWKIGRKGKDDGIIIFLFLEDRKVRIEVGYGLEGTITDIKAKQIIREVIVPKMKLNDLESAIANSYLVLDEIFSGEGNLDTAIARIESLNENSNFEFFDWKFVVAGIWFLGFAVWFAKRKFGSSSQISATNLESMKIEIQKAFEFLDENNPFWAQNQKIYDKDAVESKRLELLQKGDQFKEYWRLSSLEESKYLFWISDIEKVQKRPKECFPLGSQALVERLQSAWKELSWDSWKSSFSKESILEAKKEWEFKKEELLKSGNAKDTEKFIELLKQVKREPQLYLYPELTSIVEDTEGWVRDEQVWNSYKKQFPKKIVENHQDFVLKKLKEWKTSPPSTYIKKRKVNRIWLANVVSVRTSPNKYFTEKTNPRPWLGNASEPVHQEDSDFGSDNSTWSNSSTDSYSSSRSSSSSSGGGTFGGGGASGGW